MPANPQVLIIGAGMGGLTTACLLRLAGLDVTILEAHVYPGGSAGTFYHQGFRFDAGATLAGGFLDGGPHQQVLDQLGLALPFTAADPAWQVHLAGQTITQWRDPQRWQEERQKHFPDSEPFWLKQEKLARLGWDLMRRDFPYPPQNAAELLRLMRTLHTSLIDALPYLTRSIQDIALKYLSPSLKTFLDLQLLISAQATSQETNALYGSAALDLPRRGVVHVHGGMGGIAAALAKWFTTHGGKIYYRQQVTHLKRAKTGWQIKTNKGLSFTSDLIVANQTPWGLKNILPELPENKQLTKNLEPTWGAFMLHIGVESSQLPHMLGYHHQIINDVTQPLGEGNTIFLSFSPTWDTQRAPQGMQAVTISTHTRIEPWWQLAEYDPQAYQALKAAYTQKVLATAEQALPGFSAAIRLKLPGTPLTFQRFTRRPMGMVGGFPQTSLFHVRGPQIPFPNLWITGDSVFPGQSTAAVTLGAQRLSRTILEQIG
ncbi:MAG: FAD-dependent oxidoreductase [Chloroflexi bacterium HGW-Chloroflexi-10]|nr:MAG: FAD-dependent oxidoreductase [Chloroflexi bacterium HGW-Chloroflexi-10]